MSKVNNRNLLHSYNDEYVIFLNGVFSLWLLNILASKLENRSLFVSTVSVLLSLPKFCTVLYLLMVMQGFSITLKLKCTHNSLACLLACLHSTLHLEKPLVLCNKSQLDALFILCLFCQSTSTCFGHICSSSSGGILYIYIYIYIYNNWYMLCFFVDCLLARLGWNSADWRNKLMISSASSWFLLHRCIKMHGQQNIKKTKTIICLPSE